MIRLDSKEKLDLYLRSKRSAPTPHLSGFVIRLADAYRILQPRISNLNQLDLHGGFVESDFIRSSVADLAVFDPSLEHLYYKTHLKNFAVAPDMPRELGEFAARYAPDEDGEASYADGRDQNQLEAVHSEFWNVLEHDERARTRFIRDLLMLQLRFGATVLVPPVPLITNNERLFELSKTINIKAQEISRFIGECAHAFTFRVDCLRNPTLMDELKKFVSRQSVKGLTVLKFKNLNLNQEEKIIERAAFRNLIQELDLVSRIATNRTFPLLEAGNQTLACAGRGFDFLSTSFSIDREFRHRRIERSPWAKWYDPKYQQLRGRNEFLTIFKNNGNRIPDDCEECLATTRPDAFDKDEWNAYVKRHYLHRREKDFKEVDEAVQNGTATAGILNRLKDSTLKNLTELVR